MAKNDRIDVVEAKVDDVSKKVTNQWNALNTLAERLGISLKDDGTYFMEGVNPQIPKLGLQSDGQAVTASAPAQTMDVDTFAAAVRDKFNDNPPKVNLGKQSVPIDTKSLLESNENLFDMVTKPWNDWFIKHRKDLLKLHGYKEVKVGDATILAVDDNPEIPHNSYLEDSKPQPSDKPTEKPVKKPRFKSPFWNVTFAIVTSRTLGYFIAVIVALLALNEHQQAQKYEDDAKRYKIYRTIYQSNSEDRQVYKYFDSQIEKHGTDKVLKHVQKRDREMQLQ